MKNINIDPRKLTFAVTYDDESTQLYRFVAMRFNLDNVEYYAPQVIEDENDEVLSKLVFMKSGIIELIKD